MADPTTTRWYKALEPGELPEGRVKAVPCGLETVCMTHCDGAYYALSNVCPHQGGPLGEGSIERGLLRCPWHGWDFDPRTGAPPGGFDDGVPTYPVEVRDDGVYVALETRAPHRDTVSDVMAATMVAWGVRVVFGMVGHSNLGLADALRRQEEAGPSATSASGTRARPRSRARPTGSSPDDPPRVSRSPDRAPPIC